MRRSARSGSAIQTWSTSAARDVVRDAIGRADDRRAGDLGPVLRDVIVVERDDVEARRRCLAQALRDVLPERARAHDDDVPQVASAPAQAAQHDAHRHPQCRGAQEPATQPRADPDPRERVAHLGGEDGAPRERCQNHPRQHQPAQFLGQADAALRLVQADEREQREDRHYGRAEKQQVLFRRPRFPQIEAKGDEPDRERDRGIGEAKDPEKDVGVGL